MTSPKKVLVVDDEPNILELTRLYLTNEGFVTATASDGEEALRKIAEEEPALVILDLMLPRLDGWEVCRRLRSQGDLPVIMLTARDDDVDKIVGLEIGADDYITKPFNPRELVARVKAVLRRSEVVTTRSPSKDGHKVIGNTGIDHARRELRIENQPVALRTQEFELLAVFVDYLGLVLERDRLLNLAWGYDYFGDTRTVDVHVAHLRARLRGSCLTIETVRGIGYKMVAAESNV